MQNIIPWLLELAIGFKATFAASTQSPQIRASGIADPLKTRRYFPLLCPSLCAAATVLCMTCVYSHASEPVKTPQPPSTADAWKQLPSATVGNNTQLPSWARTLSQVAPKSTAALLELDFAQRNASPVEPGLRAAMRWVIANANHCDYAKQAAKLDAEAHAVPEDRMRGLAKQDWSSWSENEQHALWFARQMSVASHSISDDDFKKLVKAFGQRQAASMVLLCAYGNMQDRLLLCLGADAEADLKSDALAAVKVAFDPQAFQVQLKHPPVTESFALENGYDDLIGNDADWAHLSYSDLQERLSAQREKPTRLPIPDWSVIEQQIPVGLFRGPSDIVWYRIVFGYAPELALPFERFMRTSGAETGNRYGRVFATSLFWVVTRAMDCAYCMGHCEMNWEVAGLDQKQIAERSRALSSHDWSAFDPKHQRAFAFARKLSQHPEQVSPADLDALATDFGRETATVIAMHVARYHYMTRISNGFQLKLEKENVFYDYWNKSRDSKPSPKGDRSIDEDSRSQNRMKTEPYIALLSDQQTWERLPAVAKGERAALPSWAKAIATQLPRTAAAMLELDAIHRLRSPIESQLRAKLRWVIAKENRCQYSQAVALADLRRSGADQASIDLLVGDETNWPNDERDALLFAKQLTTSASTLPDKLFNQVLERYGDNVTASMVLLAAYGNFQDRIVLGLNLPLEDDAEGLPLDISFVPGALQRTPLIPENKGTAIYRDNGKAVVTLDAAWNATAYNDLQRQLESQRTRTPRLPIPSWEDVKGQLPAEMATKPTKIKWSLINYGYSPQLAIAWTTTTRTHWAEQPATRVLEESLFWVQTRTVGCNYCMGHCEMLLEAAGLDKAAIAKRTQLLAESDWSAFPEQEQRAYAFARKLSAEPWNLTAEDYHRLESDYGDHTAMSIFWWLCRGLYMTRISDGFQLPLERENVFQ